MRILLHDYSGHPFAAELARELARRGHRVLHVHAASFSTPHGDLEWHANDPETLNFRAVKLAGPVDKEHLIRRRFQEREIGCRVADLVRVFRPDVVLSANAPLDAQEQILRASRRVGARFIYWLQDIYSEAMGSLLGSRIPAMGGVVSTIYRQLERKMLRDSDAVLAISEDFLPLLRRWRVPEERLQFLPNWSPLGPFTAAAPPSPRRERLKLVYAGTLGMKHDASTLRALAAQLAGRAELLVYAEGVKAARLAADAPPNLSVRPWVDAAHLPVALAEADIAIAILDEEAGGWCVPSKVLTYLAAGRPVLGVLPARNAAARLLRESGAGLVVRPADREAIAAAAEQLLADPVLRMTLGRRGLDYARRHFAIGPIADRIEAILGVPAAGPRARQVLEAMG
jgi:colanic acid biosynthesis glycosyl transferase WcaI